MLTNLEPHDVLFIDEIHRLSPVVEEVLYPAMEDYQLDIMIGEGPAARSIARSAAVHAGGRYHPRRLADLAAARSLRHCPAAGVLSGGGFAAHRLAQRRVPGVGTVRRGAHEVARAGAGTPRIANRLLRRVRDFAEVRASRVISGSVAAQALDMLNVDAEGFDYMIANCCWRLSTSLPAARSGWTTWRRRSAKSAKPSRT